VSSVTTNDVDHLLQVVYDRIGRDGLTIYADKEGVAIDWRREYESGGLSDLRSVFATTLFGALSKVLEWEDSADVADAAVVQ